MLTPPENLLFLHFLDDGLQGKLLHHLSRDGGEADRPVVPWLLLLALLEDWRDTGLSPVLGHLSCPPGPLKDDGEQLKDDEEWDARLVPAPRSSRDTEPPSMGSGFSTRESPLSARYPAAPTGAATSRPLFCGGATNPFFRMGF